MTNMADFLADVPLVAILRARDASRFEPAVRVLQDAGVRAVEVTLTTIDAVDCIRHLRAAMPELLVGAGTLRSRADVLAAREAGAQFFVSQTASRELRKAAAELGVEYIPGAVTPTEVSRCRAHGASIVKISPVGPVGGVSYVRELLAPMPDAQVFATGDVRLEDVVGYLDAGAAVVGLSRHLLRDSLEPDGDLIALGARTAATVREVRARHHPKQNLEEEVGR